MKTLSVAIATAVTLLCLASPVAADPRDSVDRGDRMDRDAIRDDVHTDRLRVPRHTLSAEQPPVQQELTASPKAKPKTSKKQNNQ